MHVPERPRRGRKHRARWWVLFGALLVVGVLGLSACGGGDEAAAPAAPAPAEPAPAEPAPAEPAPAEPPAESTPTDTGGTSEGSAQFVTITDYVAYTGGTDGPADMSLEPVKIGWANTEGGSVAAIGASSTPAAEWGVKYINDHLGGIDGHPLELVECFVKNAEEEGLACGQQFLNDDAIKVVEYGGLSVGANTINSTIAGTKPIIMAFSLNPSDVSNPNTYILFAAGNFALYGWGTFGQQILGAKTGAVIYPEGPGLQSSAEGVKEASDAAGITTKLVAFDPNSTDLVGALTAAGAQDADMISPILAAPEHCLAADRGMNQLGIDPTKVVGFFDCSGPKIAPQFESGDAPKWYYGIAQSGDAFVNPPNETGQAFRDALAEYEGNSDNASDPWYSSSFSLMLTTAQFMNAVGYDNLTPEAITEQAANFKGPLLLGGPVIHCGKYPDSPAVCTDGDHFFQYQGDQEYKSIDGWIQTPVELQKKLGATTVG